jgi:PAS domain S-box-containing protein
MKPQLRILHLEDDLGDAELIQETLWSDGIGCQATRVETEIDFIAALQDGGFDLILADYTLPSFDGLSALKIAQERLPGAPFIFVSGTLDEEAAIEALKIGATDYVFKTRLSRITPSVQRALREAEKKAELDRADAALRRSEGYLAEAERLTHSGSWARDIRTQDTFWSREMYRILGYDPAKVRPSLSNFLGRVHPEDRPRIEQRTKTESTDGEWVDSGTNYRIILADGSIRHIHSVSHPVVNELGEVVEVVGTSRDVTEQYEARAALETAFKEIQALKDQLHQENIALREEIDKISMFEEIVGSSPAIQTVLARVAKVAPTDSTVLITGESGTGKELIARAIHKRSHRSSRAFVSVNCAAVPVGLIASELFGHEKGAFTGALQRRVGKFELAAGGTLFLDEIGDLPAETQIALLRVLQEREFERIGGNELLRADVRVITATNRNLEAAIDDGVFRQDLFYRLNVFPISIPPLRERKEDIPLLIEYFIHRYSKKAGKKIGALEKRTLEFFESYAWPGNIRELQNVIERSVIVCESELFSVDPSWLSSESSFPRPNGNPSTRNPAVQEKEEIESALAATGGRVSGPQGAAAKLGMPASTLESKIRSLKINKYRYKKT